MYIPKGYDSVSEANKSKSIAVPSLFDFEKRRYLSVSEVWGKSTPSAVNVSGDMYFILQKEKPHNNYMHQEYEL